MLAPEMPAFTFYKNLKGVDMALCGEGREYQVQVQSSLYTDFTLLRPTPADEPGHDKRLAALVEKVNETFDREAKGILEARRKEMRKTGAMGDPDRLELTVLITNRGLQVAFVQAGHRKEVAKAPRKPLWRVILGPILPKRHWEMPTGDSPASETAAKPTAAKATASSKKTAKKR